eukprot:TRINITY_DN19283_c0_g2_i1.p1 TRINITY_DN19283_c0_g2~~TRINITY_DN19283_c0_g2_i1.p1  ORF type:complete len:677 (+),score=136.41 TRINITY_DN19283_c0_g2_i1:33-2033(+)
MVQKYGMERIDLPLPEDREGYKKEEDHRRSVFDLLPGFGREAAAEDLRCPIFVSKTVKTADAVLMLLCGTGRVAAGQWARKLCINESLYTGSVIPFLEWAHARGIGVVVLNPNATSVRTASGLKRVPFNTSAEEHTTYVWDKIVEPLPARHLLLVAHSYGGVGTCNLMYKRGRQVLERLRAIAFTDSVHGAWGAQGFTDAAKDFFCRRSVNWVESTHPLGTLVSKPSGCPRSVQEAALRTLRLVNDAASQPLATSTHPPAPKEALANPPVPSNAPPAHSVGPAPSENVEVVPPLSEGPGKGAKDEEEHGTSLQEILSGTGSEEDPGTTTGANASVETDSEALQTRLLQTGVVQTVSEHSAGLATHAGDNTVASEGAEGNKQSSPEEDAVPSFDEKENDEATAMETETKDEDKGQEEREEEGDGAGEKKDESRAMEKDKQEGSAEQEEDFHSAKRDEDGSSSSQNNSKATVEREERGGEESGEAEGPKDKRKKGGLSAKSGGDGVACSRTRAGPSVDDYWASDDEDEMDGFSVYCNCACVSAGTNVHEETTMAAFRPICEYFLLHLKEAGATLGTRDIRTDVDAADQGELEEPVFGKPPSGEGSSEGASGEEESAESGPSTSGGRSGKGLGEEDAEQEGMHADILKDSGECLFGRGASHEAKFAADQ